MSQTMRWGLLGARLGILALKIIIVLIILLAIVPLAMGGLDVRLPESEEASWEMEGDVLRLSTPVEVRNGGYFNIEDFTVSFSFEDDSGDVVFNASTEPVDLIAGRTTTFDLDLSIDIGDIEADELRKIVFDGATYDLVVDVETYYMMKLMRLGVSLSNSFEWSPLVSGFEILESEIRFERIDTTAYVFVPYRIYSSEMIAGQEIAVGCEVSNATAQIGFGQEAITMSSVTEGEFRIAIDEEAAAWMGHNSEALTITITLDYMGATAHESVDYYWIPPGP